MEVTEIVKMVQDVFKSGGTAKIIRMGPAAFEELTHDGERYNILMIAGIPVDVDAECPPDKIFVMQG